MNCYLDLMAFLTVWGSECKCNQWEPLGSVCGELQVQILSLNSPVMSAHHRV